MYLLSKEHEFLKTAMTDCRWHTEQCYALLFHVFIKLRLHPEYLISQENKPHSNGLTLQNEDEQIFYQDYKYNSRY